MKFFLSVFLVTLVLSGAAFAGDPDPVVKAASVLSEWGAAWFPILALIAPTLIVGVTAYRRDGVVGFILAVLNVFSVSTHKDSPGTFKLPLTQSEKPDDPGIVEFKPRGYTRMETLFLILVGVISIFCCSCAAFKTAARDADVRCQRDEVKKLIPAMRAFLDSVEQRDRGDLFKIQGDFLGVFAKADADDLACTVKDTVANYFGPNKPLAVPDPAPDADTPPLGLSGPARTALMGAPELRVVPDRPAVSAVLKLRRRLKHKQPIPTTVADL